MSLDAVHLARLQFAFTMAFHIIFPAFSIGLASYLAVLEALWLRSGKQVYLDLFQYWLKAYQAGHPETDPASQWRSYLGCAAPFRRSTESRVIL